MNEDRQIKKIIKQLRKSVKSHDKQADTLEKKLNEEGLRAWFGKSRSKGGKPGWVQVVSGKPCARQPGQKSTPKCVSSAKRASMSDAERKSAQRRKRKADPNQRFKSGAAKPTYVRTDSKRKMKKEDMHSDWKNEELFLYEVKDKKGKGSGKKDACYHKVKSRYSVWPSAYASGALVKCRKKGAKNWGNSTKKEEFVPEAARFEKETGMTKDQKIARRDERLEKDAGKKPVSMSTTQMRAQIHSLKHDGTQKKSKGEKPVRYNQKMQRTDSRPDSPRTTYSHKYGQRITKEETQLDTFQQFQEKCWKGYEKKGMKTMFGKRYPNCVKKTKSEEVEVDTSSNVSEEFYRKKYDVKKGGYVKTDKMTKSNKRSGDSKAEYRDVHKDLAKYKIKKLKTEEMGNIAHTKTKKDGKTIIKVNKNDEADAQAAMKNDPKYILGKTRVQPYKEGYSANPAQQAAIAIAKKEKKERDMVAKKTKKEDWRSELGYVEEAKKKTVRIKLNPSKKIGVKVTDIGAGGKEYVRKNTMNEASPLPPPDKDPRKKPDPNQKPQSPYLPGKSPFKNKKIDEAKSPAWQRKAGKSESGGLNAKGVASYRAANPGSKLKTAVTTKPSKLKKGSKAANRRKSFCARMKGMKKRLTSAKTARDPDSRINKSLRKWNC